MTNINNERKAALARIKSDIDRYGYHIYLISGDDVPRYAYTIGLFEKFGLELVFAGGYYFLIDEVKAIFKTAFSELVKKSNAGVAGFDVVDLGHFDLRPVDPSWAKFMLLGAFDFYKNNQIKAIQICPAKEFRTIDVPDMANAWASGSESIWKELGSDEPATPRSLSRAATNMAALRGAKITEAARWEDDDWELFAGNGPDVLPEDVRVVPLNMLVAADPSLKEIADLEVGQARWRRADEIEWRVWT